MAVAASAGLVALDTITAPKPAAIWAQQLVERTLAAHPELAGLELAMEWKGACRTIAATDPKEIGELCDADETGPMKTGLPNVELPTKADPVFEITQALHDSSGRLVGVVGLDLKPLLDDDRSKALARSRSILHDLESQIPSKEKLLEPAKP